MMMTNQLLFAAQRVWERMRSMSRQDERRPGSLRLRGHHERALVGALCTFVLGKRGPQTAEDWPPQSVAELMRHAITASDSRLFELPASDLRDLLEQGLAALDEAVLVQTGWRFPMVDHASQSRALFQLESGRLALSRRRATAFIDAFLALAAEAYLRDPRDAMDGLDRSKLH